MAWKVSTAQKKSVTDVETWTNDKGEVLKHVTGWRWGTWIVNDEKKPDLGEYDEEEGMDPMDLGDDVELWSTDDGVYEEWDYPDSWKKKDIRKFEKAWEKEWHEAPINLGFSQDDTETWICGPLDIEPYERPVYDHADAADDGE